jgi:putative FmdB family regulatory protein
MKLSRTAATVAPEMPIYEYVCMSCESHFEELVRHDETPKCPDCGAKKVQRQFSVFAAHGTSGSQPSFSGPTGGGGGCCGGSCGCGH